ncbi:tetratricopeptide repeat protein [Methanolobus sp. WCC5]|uniref:tetratricopeptide repeat protein n=1 Tax=Methanolobus sp. WCC5 TaxID=3125785 RepID=UPI0032474E6B
MGMLDDVKSKKKQKAAENWMKMGDSAKTIEKQIEYYTKSLDIDPYNAEAWFKKGKGLEKLGRFEEAKKSFDLAVEIDPDYQGLVDKKYEPSVPSDPQIEEEFDFVVEPSVAVAAETNDSEEQWITEDLQSVSEEIQTPQEDELREDELRSADEYSFRPPSGDESAFSTMFIGEDDDNGTPSTHKEETEDAEDENLFGSGHKAAPVDNEPEIISGGSYSAGREEVNEEGNKEESEEENERNLPVSSSGYVEAEKETLPERDMSPEEGFVFKREDVALAAEENDVALAEAEAAAAEEEEEVALAAAEDVAPVEEAIDEPMDETIGIDDTIRETGESGTAEKTDGYVDEKQETGDEKEDAFFTSVQSPVAKAAPYSADADENVISGRKPESAAHEAISEAIPVAGESYPLAAKHNKQAAAYDASSGTIAAPRSVATSGVGPVDIRIPLSEAIKFWAIGIVAMLIVLIISSVL